MRMIALAGALLLLTACGNETAAGGEALSGKSYLSTSVTGKQLATGTRVRLQFTDDGRLIADAGCNTLQAPVSTSGGKLKLKEPPSMTDMGCPGNRGEQDTWLSNLLQATPTWKADGSTLTVTSGEVTIALTDRAVAEPDIALDGVRWMLDGIITGDTVSHQNAAPKAWLTFNGNRVTGNTGCNDLQGTIARTATTITFGDLATTRRACGDPLEKTLLAGLKGEMTYKITNKQLTLTLPTSGFTFVAP